MRPSGRLEETPTQEILKLTTLLQVSSSLSGTLDLKAALHDVLVALAKHHHAVRTIVVLINRETQELHVEASDGSGRLCSSRLPSRSFTEMIEKGFIRTP